MKHSTRARTASRKKVSRKPVIDPEKKNFVIGFEDCVCTLEPFHTSISEMSRAVSNAKEIPGAKEWVNKLFEDGNTVCFLTPLPASLRDATQKWLKKHGFKFNSIVMDKPRALMYHYVDDRHVQATTFKGKYTPLIRKERTIEVFE